ncbi:DUF502 domain-containing protein [Chloroflexota bacterium]
MMAILKETVINIREYLKDVVTFRVKASILDVIDSESMESFKEKIISSCGFLKDVITFRIKPPTQQTFGPLAMKPLKETVSAGSKVGTQKVFDFSRKYITMAQAQALAGTQTTRNMLITTHHRLPVILRRRFIAGLQVLIPLGVTILILVWFFSKIDNILQPVISSIFGRTISGVGFGITVLLIFIAGVIVSSVAGRKLINYGESILLKVPIIRQLYSSIKQIVESFSSEGKGSFMRVVLVEFPKKGMKTVGFVTNQATDQSGKILLNVFIPTAPNPTSGFLQIMAEKEVIRTDISVDDALKMIISAGKVSAKEITDKFNGKTPDITEMEIMLKNQMKDS